MALSNNGRIRVNVTGARGALGIDLQGTPNPGQFLVKAPGGGRSFNTITPISGPADAVPITDLAAPTGANLVGYGGGSASEKLDRSFRTPEDHGAVGYSTAAAALSGTDSTEAIQELADYAAANRVSINGNGRWYKVSTVSWPSYSHVQNLNCVVPNTTIDTAPFFVDGVLEAKRDITFVNCKVDGNRVGRTAMTSSGGDGQSAAFKFFGRHFNVRCIQCVGNYCATDGFFIWTGEVVPGNADDLLSDGLQLIDCEARWNGRHGRSITSHRNTIWRGGVFKDNGKDIPGFSGVYSDGGYARRLPGNITGTPYGRPSTHEEFFLGEHYENWTIENSNETGNVAGILIFRCMFPTKRSAKSLRIIGSSIDDPNGAVGDGALVIYAVNVPNNDGSGVRTMYSGNDAFDGIFITGCNFDRNYINISNARNIVITGCEHPNVTASQYCAIYTNCLNVISSDIKSNKPQLGRPSPISAGTISLPSGWNAGTQNLSAPKDSGTDLKFFYTTVLTPDGAGTEKTSFVFSGGYSLRPTFLSVLNNNTAAPVTGSLVSGTNGMNELDLWLSPINSDPLAVTIGFEATPNP